MNSELQSHLRKDYKSTPTHKSFSKTLAFSRMPGLFVTFFKTSKMNKKGLVWVGLGQRSNTCEHGLRVLKFSVSVFCFSLSAPCLSQRCVCIHTRKYMCTCCSRCLFVNIANYAVSSYSLH